MVGVETPPTEFCGVSYANALERPQKNIPPGEFEFEITKENHQSMYIYISTLAIFHICAKFPEATSVQTALNDNESTRPSQRPGAFSCPLLTKQYLCCMA